LVFALIYALVPQDVRVVMFKDQIDTLNGVGNLRANIVAAVGNFWLNYT
jgi:hypothetical protein